MKPQGTVGIYCLANDNVLNWFIALCESLRSFEPTIPLVVIPFDNAIEKVSRLQHKYNFEFFDDGSLNDLDQIGATLYPENYTAAHLHRKFSVFWGPFDHFLFLDSDIVVVSKLQNLLRTYLLSPCHLLCFDCALDQVYGSETFRDRMVREYSANGFNTGAFVSSKGTLTMEDIKSTVSEAIGLVKDFAPPGEQPFFNYCVDIEGLSVLKAADVISDLSVSTWGALTPYEEVDGKHRLMNQRSDLYNKHVLFIHWAGLQCNSSMPNKEIFLRYRLKGRPWIARVTFMLTFYKASLREPVVKLLGRH